MNVRGAVLAVLPILAAILAGCGSMQIDTQPQGGPNRVATGTVELGDNGDLPPGSVVTVRVVDTIQAAYQSPTAVLGEPSADASGLSMPPQVVGEKTISDAQGSSIPFQVSYTATPEQLGRGLRLEARISIDGKLRYYNANSYSLNLANAAEQHHIYVNPAQR